jgi:hypothetical protein
MTLPGPSKSITVEPVQLPRPQPLPEPAPAKEPAPAAGLTSARP